MTEQESFYVTRNPFTTITLLMQLQVNGY